MELVLPQNYVEIEQEEMEYLDGGEMQYMEAPGKLSKEKWIYMYTAQPYAFYKNSKTGEIKMVQVTSINQHLINVVTKKWADSIANAGNYFGGRP
ncbi:hypothetical protein ABGF49_05675 [Helcococcus ovis]|uniref:Uncharacterized protein n=2 Tax=Helcococcus ovis TaxID=72026 RepID=A0A4R9C3P3_9FIRM|nr:hypothetical protein [Helcococcus ovis]TFF63915.1 hypothetical protein EQF92_07920 [Helcococcus ovis]TFF66130.1 hypothetical protein EQF93_07560 [Helcococcus ovis]TFF67021.1 hypothetical protein EQF91_02530 [Helcococcus ovis]WNZ01360.1 hypothetical protein EQF90_000475 [Helcococcus ovis]